MTLDAVRVRAHHLDEHEVAALKTPTLLLLRIATRPHAQHNDRMSESTRNASAVSDFSRNSTPATTPLSLNPPLRSLGRFRLAAVGSDWPAQCRRVRVWFGTAGLLVGDTRLLIRAIEQ